MNLPSDMNSKYQTLHNRVYSANDVTIQRCIETFYELCEKSSRSPEEYENIMHHISVMTTEQKRDLMCNHLCGEAANRDFLEYITMGQSGNVCDHLLHITTPSMS